MIYLDNVHIVLNDLSRIYLFVFKHTSDLLFIICRIEGLRYL